MLRPMLGVLVILFIIALSEWLWLKKLLKTEWSRKLVHIGVGTFVAFWPFFTTFGWIQVLSLAFLVIISLSRAWHVLGGIHNIKRKSIGELFYPVGIGLAALVTTDKYVFAAAVLTLSLADGLAAIIGITYGKKHRFHVGKLTKSYIGSLTFMVVTAIITAWAVQYVPTVLASGIVVAIVALTATFVEAVAPYGSDNLFIPLTVILLLRFL